MLLIGIVQLCFPLQMLDIFASTSRTPSEQILLSIMPLGLPFLEHVLATSGKYEADVIFIPPFGQLIFNVLFSQPFTPFGMLSAKQA